MTSACATQATFQTAKRPSPEFCVRPRWPSPLASGHVIRTAAASAAAASMVAWRMRTPCRMSSILHDPSSSLPAATLLGLPAAALLAAVAAWLSQGTLAVGGLDGARIGLLPLSPFAIAAAVLAGAAVIALARAGASLAPVWLLTVIVLPWLPLPVPAVFLIWAGSIRWLIWAAVVLSCSRRSSPSASRPGAQRLLPRAQSLVRDRPQLAAGVLRVCHLCLRRVAGVAVGSGRRRAALPRHHAEPAARRRSENREQPPARRLPGVLRRRAARRTTSAAAPTARSTRSMRPGLSALVAPAFAVGGYRGVVVFLLLVIASCGSALAWHLAWLATGRAAAAWFGWAAVTLAATTIFHSFTVYPDGLGSVIALTGVWALLRRGRGAADGRRAACCRGSSTARRSRSCRGCTADSRCSRAASARSCCCACRRRRTRRGRRWRFSRCPRSARSLWMGFFRAIYGVADPSAPYGTVREFSLGFIPGGLAGLLFDQRFGLFANAPVLIVGLAGLVMMLRVAVGCRPRRTRAALADRRLALELLFVMVPYLLTATSYAMWWAGWSAPARFANPAVLILAIPCAVAWSRIQNRGSRPSRRARWPSPAFCRACSSSPMADGSPTTRARRPRCGSTGHRSWRPWPTALPVWFRGQEGAFAIDIGSMGGGVRAGLVVRARARGRGRFARTRPSAHGHYCGSHRRGDARGQRCLAASRRRTACWPRRPSSTSSAAWQRSRERSPLQVMPPRVACGWTAARDVAARAGGACVALAGAGAATRRSPSCRRFRLAAIGCASRAAGQAA